MLSMDVKVKLLRETAKIPSYANPGDAGFDFVCTDSFYVPPRGIAIALTGLAFEIPEGYEIQVRSRSGLAANRAVFVLNSPGTIDSGYRGEVKIILQNTSDRIQYFEPGDRVAQGVLQKVPNATFIVVDELSSSVRGAGGLGSTGV